MAESDDAAEVERQRVAALAARLARETGDEKLVTLVDLARHVDAADSIRRSGRYLNAAERWLARADRWLRVWAHVAESDVRPRRRAACS